LACIHKKPTIARNLIEAGIELDTVDNYKNTPLLLASAYGQETIVKKILKKYRGNIDYINSNNKTALYTALENHHYAIARLLLLGNGANPKAGEQPLPNTVEAGIILEMLAQNKNVISPLVAAAAAAGVKIPPKHKAELPISVTNPLAGLAAVKKGGYKKSRHTRRRKTRKSLKRKSRR
jgi:ankyrin repeat protein